MHLPSEIEAIAVIPALRSMLARELMSHGGLSQTQVASLLGVTQAAVSNYLSGNRGREIRYLDDPRVKVRVSDIANSLSGNPDSSVAARCLSDLTDFIRRNRLMCSLHRDIDPEIDIELCHICDG
jgi:predicted transcriptional regulator